MVLFCLFLVFQGIENKFPLKNVALMSQSAHMNTMFFIALEALGRVRLACHLPSWLWHFKGKCNNSCNG